MSAVDPRWAAALMGKGSTMACRHQSAPLGRSAWRICNDLGELRPPRFDIGRATGPPDEGCLVISVGIGGSWELEDRLAGLGCSVHAFDPTHELHKSHAEHAQSRPRTRFYFAGLGAPPQSAAGGAEKAGLYGGIAADRLKPLDEVMRIAREGRLRQAVDVLKIDCEGCEWDAFADAARRTPTLLASVQHLLIEVHLTPRYGLRSSAQLNTLMEHLVDTHGFRLFRKPRKNRGFPWARNQTLPALASAGGDRIACCAELHFSRPEHSGAFRSHAAWLARLEPAYAAAQQQQAAHLGEAHEEEPNGTSTTALSTLGKTKKRRKKRGGP